MTAETEAAAGHYARKQIHCADGLIRWSHARRFAMARKLVEPCAGGKLLDYGCGDGTFLGMVQDLFPVAAGVDLEERQIEDCCRRLGHLKHLSFLPMSALQSAGHAGAYQVVTCMEVLEHCPPGNLEQVIANLKRLVSPSGFVIMSVPVEIGPSLPIKQAARCVAGWRNLGDYRHGETYGWSELCKMLFASAATRIERPVYGSGDAAFSWHGHKGFNWRALNIRLEQDFEVRHTLFTPLGLPGGWFASQAWFVCKPKLFP